MAKLQIWLELVIKNDLDVTGDPQSLSTVRLHELQALILNVHPPLLPAAGGESTEFRQKSRWHSQRSPAHGAISVALLPSLLAHTF